VLAAALFVALLRDRRVPISVWLVMGAMLSGNLLLATLQSHAIRDGALRYFGII